MYEQAIEYFNQAAKVQPSEIKWQLMVTSCYRRLGDLYKALELYQKVRLLLLLSFFMLSYLLFFPSLLF
jgi:tetratricopeptide (TPR) repeat protein